MTYASAVPQFAGGRGCGHGTHHRSGHGRPGWEQLVGRWLEMAAAAERGGPRGRGRRHGRHGGRGGPFPGFGGSHFGPRGPRARRGDVRAALLALLAEEPRNGYQLMQEIEHRSDGVWRPSSGSVYPALAQLEDEGLVRAEQREGSRTFTLTDAGREHVEADPDTYKEPWRAVTEGVGDDVVDVRGEIWQLGAAVMQVVSAGDEAQVAEARKVLADARKSLYRILAEDDPQSDAPTGTGTV